MDILGTVVGSPQAHHRHVQTQCIAAVRKLALYDDLHFDHDRFILARMCWLPLLVHTFRTTPSSLEDMQTNGIEDMLKVQEAFLTQLRGGDRQSTAAHARLDVHTRAIRAHERLPVRMGGIGMTSPVDVAPMAYDASHSLARFILHKHTAGMRIPAPLQTPFNHAPPQVPGAPRPELPDKQRILMIERVHPKYIMDIEAFHSFDIDGADPHRQARFHFLERNSGTRIANAWLGPSGPGSLPGSLVLSNSDFQAALARWTVFCEESLTACDLCGLPVTQHDHRCYLHTSTPRHDAVADALRLVLDPAYAGHGDGIVARRGRVRVAETPPLCV